MKRTDLHEYQNYCVDFLKTHAEAMLILEMGLGKSAISLTAIADLMFDSFDVDVQNCRRCSLRYMLSLDRGKAQEGIAGVQNQRRFPLRNVICLYRERAAPRECIPWGLCCARR